eukprot:gene27492-835_t
MKRIRLDEAGASAPGTPADAGGSSRSSPAGTAHGLFGDPYSLDHLSSLAASLTEVAGDPSLVSGKVEVDRVAEWVGVAVLRDAARVLDAINRPIAALLELDADEGSDPGNSAAGTAVAMPGADCGCADDSLTGYAGYNLGLTVLTAATGATAAAAGMVIARHGVALKRLAKRTHRGWHPDASIRDAMLRWLTAAAQHAVGR